MVAAATAAGDGAVRDAAIQASDDDLARACELDRYRASGPGGQHRGMTESAVRARHLPTGVQAHAAGGLAGRGLVWISLDLTGVAMLTATIWVGVWAYRRWGPGRRRGMATAAEAEKILGVTRLRKVADIVRPDLYGKHANATAAPVQRTAGDLTEQTGPQLGHGLSPWILNDRRTKEER